MASSKRPIRLNDEERATIERLSSDRSLPQRIRRRALAVMDLGLTGVEISRRTGFAQMHVSKLRRRFWEEGLAGLPDRRPVQSVDKSKLPVRPRARPVVLQHHERARLRALSKDPKTPPHISHRARALLLMSEGARNTEVSRQVGYTIEYLSKLRRRFARERMRLVAHPRKKRDRAKIPSGCSPSWPEMSSED